MGIPRVVKTKAEKVSKRAGFTLKLSRKQAVDLCLLWGGSYATAGHAPDRVQVTIDVLRNKLVDLDESLEDEQFRIWASSAK